MTHYQVQLYPGSKEPWPPLITVRADEHLADGFGLKLLSSRRTVAEFPVVFAWWIEKDGQVL